MPFIQRRSQDTILRSEKLPDIVIQIDPSFRYAGGTSFILYDLARVEQHHFVVTDEERRVLRHLWFQFEGYLENNSHTYDYSGLEELRLDGFTFLHNTDAMNIEQDYAARADSDSAHVVDFFRDKGYRLPEEVIFHRMVWLDAERRNELMIIYSEDLNESGYRLLDLTGGGPAAAQWPTLSQAVQKRSLSSFKIL